MHSLSLLELNCLCQRLQFSEFLYEIDTHLCYLEKFKEQEFEEYIFYYVPKMEH